MRPLLSILADGQDRTRRELRVAASDMLGLSEEDRDLPDHSPAFIATAIGTDLHPFRE